MADVVAAREQRQRALLRDHLMRRGSQLNRLQQGVAEVKPRLEARRDLLVCGGATAAALEPEKRPEQQAGSPPANAGRKPAGEGKRDLDGEGGPAEAVSCALSRAGSFVRGRSPTAFIATPMTELQAVQAALRQLDEAQEAFGRGDPDGGWVRLHNAEELEVLSYAPAELERLHIRLSQEVEAGEFSDGLAGTLRELLTRAERLLPEEAPGYFMLRRFRRRTDLQRARELLREALERRNEHFETQFHARRVTAVRRIFLLVIVLFLAGALVSLLVVSDVYLNSIAERGPGATYRPPPPWVLLSGLAAGAIGAVMSAIQRLAAHPTVTSPVELDSLTATLTRPVVGAVAAATVYLAWVAEFVRFPGPAPVAYFWLASFGVGFTERLVVYHPPHATKTDGRG